MTESKLDMCKVVADLMPLYIDGVCGEDSKQLVEKYMDQCPDCRQQYEAMTAGVVLDDATIQQNLKAKEALQTLQQKTSLSRLPAAFASGAVGGLVIYGLLLLLGVGGVYDAKANGRFPLELAIWAIGGGIFNCLFHWCYALFELALDANPKRWSLLVLPPIVCLVGFWCLGQFGQQWGYYWSWIPFGALLLVLIGAASVVRLSGKFNR